jgi:hypothetical protein
MHLSSSYSLLASLQYADPPFSPPLLLGNYVVVLIQVSLGAVNSINWARVLAQITYYFHAYFQVTNKLPGRRDKVGQLGASLVSLKRGEWGEWVKGWE